jgi:hypothetical protein
LEAFSHFLEINFINPFLKTPSKMLGASQIYTQVLAQAANSGPRRVNRPHPSVTGVTVALTARISPTVKSLAMEEAPTCSPRRGEQGGVENGARDGAEQPCRR